LTKTVPVIGIAVEILSQRVKKGNTDIGQKPSLGLRDISGFTIAEHRDLKPTLFLDVTLGKELLANSICPFRMKVSWLGGVA
jgi:hypothetical protein